MTSSFPQGSATIYQFPARGRFAASAPHDEAKLANVASPSIVVGGGWYHEEAIREAERERQN